MFLYEGDCLKNITEIRGIRYVTVSHYSGDTGKPWKIAKKEKPRVVAYKAAIRAV